MPNLLKVDQVDAIGFVDKGANQGSAITFWKRLTGGNEAPDTGRGEQMPELDVTTLPEEAQAYIKSLEAKVEKDDGEAEGGLKSWFKDQIASLRTDLSGDGEPNGDGADEGAGDEGDALDKAAPEIRKAMSDLEKRAADAEKEARDTREKVEKLEDQRKAEAIAKRVGDEMSFIADESTADLMKRIADEVTPEDFDALMSLERAANERVRQSGLFKELGAGGSGDLTAHDEVDKKARERVAKSDSVTYEQAYADVLQEDPELAARVNTEAN